MAMQMTPIVATVPKPVPMSTDMSEHKRKHITRQAAGESSRDDQATMVGIVPLARQMAVRAPITTKSRMTFLTVETLLTESLSRSRRRFPRASP